MSLACLPVEELALPISAEAPCGADLEYDAAFLALEDAARHKPEQQYGDTVIAAREPDWRAVHEQALALAHQTRDLRVAVMLARSGARLHGVASYASALTLIADLLEMHWEHLFPKLDAADGNDATMRLNALAPLADAGTGLADLRSAVIGHARPPLTVRQLELAACKSEPHPGENIPTFDGVVQGAKAAELAHAGTLDALKLVQQQVQRIDALVSAKVGAAGPELRPLQLLAKALCDVALQAEGSAPVEDHEEDSPAARATNLRSSGGALHTRSDVARLLDQACEWLEQHEPAHPAPLLIRRAQRLLGKSFIEIVRDLAPAGIDQIENIAGAPRE